MRYSGCGFPTKNKFWMRIPEAGIRAFARGIPLPPIPAKALLGAGSAKSPILIYRAQSLRGKILMSKNLAAKERCIFGSTERFGCTMMAGFENGRKVRCHTELWKSWKACDVLTVSGPFYSGQAL